MSSSHRKCLKPIKVAAAIAFVMGASALMPSLSAVNAQEQLPSVEGMAVLPRDLSPWGMFMNADVVVKAVMIGLVVASIVTWTVWLAKTIELLKARRRVRAALEALALFKPCQNIKQSNVKEPAASFCAAAIAELRLSDGATDKDGLKERIASRLERIEAAFSRRISRGTGVLATIGATAPFIGLFGTVWGIMNSFIGISKISHDKSGSCRARHCRSAACDSPRACRSNPRSRHLQFFLAPDNELPCGAFRYIGGSTSACQS